MNDSISELVDGILLLLVNSYFISAVKYLPAIPTCPFNHYKNVFICLSRIHMSRTPFCPEGLEKDLRKTTKNLNQFHSYTYFAV